MDKNKDEIEYIPNELIKNELMKPKNNDEYKKGIAYIQALQNHRRGV